MIRALLIEDNAPARADLRDRLKAHPEIVVAGEAESVGRARPLLARGDYDLVFLDIKLRGGDAFELLPLVVETARVIFVTAHDEYALRAFETNALDYLLKPVSPERLAGCLAKLARARISAPFPPAPEKDGRGPLIRLLTDGGMQLVAVDDIVAIFAEQNYTQVLLRSGQRRLVRRTLKDWENRLPQGRFIRASREALVALLHIVRFERKGDRAAQIMLAGQNEPINASNRRASSVRAALGRCAPP